MFSCLQVTYICTDIHVHTHKHIPRCHVFFSQPEYRMGIRLVTIRGRWKDERNKKDEEERERNGEIKE